MEHQHEELTRANEAASIYRTLLVEDDFFRQYDKSFSDFVRSILKGNRLRVKGKSEEDLIQSAKMKVLSLFRKGRIRTSSPKEVNSYIYAVCRSVIFDALRKQKRSPEKVVPPQDLLRIQDSSQEGAHPEDRLAIKSTMHALSLALQTLPEDQQKVLQLAYIEEMPHAEIAKKLRLPLGTVKSKIRLAKRDLKKALKDTPNPFA